MIFYHFVGLSLKQIKEPFLEGKSQTLKEIHSELHSEKIHITLRKNQILSCMIRE